MVDKKLLDELLLDASACEHIKAHYLVATDLSTQRGPNAESVTRPVEAFSQRVSSSTPFFCRCSVKRTRLINSFIQNKRDSHTGDTERIRKRFLLT